MPYSNINFTIDNRVGRITFSRPPLNVLNIAMMREIKEALSECRAKKDMVAIVFDASSDSRAFSAGVAIDEHADATIYQMLDSFHEIFRSLEHIAKPAIAKVDGAALGGGCEFVAACDIVIASERARFGQPEIKLGVFPPVAAVLLPRVIGDKKARELVFTGELFNAQEALRLGLVNYVVASSELTQKTEEVVGKLRELSATSLESTKRAFNMGRGFSFDQALEGVENYYLNELMKTEDAREGIDAFMQKRKPNWRNR